MFWCDLVSSSLFVTWSECEDVVVGGGDGGWQEKGMPITSMSGRSTRALTLRSVAGGESQRLRDVKCDESSMATEMTLEQTGQW